jgi:hypothetical protein
MVGIGPCSYLFPLWERLKRGVGGVLMVTVCFDENESSPLGAFIGMEGWSR